jgi:hypothetical protein
MSSTFDKYNVGAKKKIGTNNQGLEVKAECLFLFQKISTPDFKISSYHVIIS